MHSMTRLDSQIDEFKNSNPIPEPITYGFGGLGGVLPANERIQINNELSWIELAGS
jgi:hypothetical protein